MLNSSNFIFFTLTLRAPIKVNYIFGCCIYLGWIQSIVAIIFGICILCGKVDFDDWAVSQLNEASQVISNHDAYRLKTSSQIDHNLTHRSNLFKNPPPPISNRSEFTGQEMYFEPPSSRAPSRRSRAQVSRKSSRSQS